MYYHDADVPDGEEKGAILVGQVQLDLPNYRLNGYLCKGSGAVKDHVTM